MEGKEIYFSYIILFVECRMA